MAKVHPDVDVVSNDMKYHMEFGQSIKDNNEVLDVTKE